MEKQSPLVAAPSGPFRPGTHLSQDRLSFVLSGGGLGDYILYIKAFQWIRENCPYLNIQLFVPPFFYELATHWLPERRDFKVFMTHEIATKYKKGDPAIGPDYPQRDQLHNACGAHPLALGFQYYANSDIIPEGYNKYPELNFGPEALPGSLGGRKYVVLTPGSTTPARSLDAGFWNAMICHVQDLGLLPVFLGKTNVTCGYGARFPQLVGYSQGLDLREKTTLLEAAAIMQHAEFTLGLDNGLLHLANCTPGPVIFAYNVAAPRHRRTPRPHAGARTEEIIITKEELSCINCQSEMKLMYKHDFANCFYSDYRCLSLLYADNCARWKTAIAHILSAAPKAQPGE